MNTTQQIIERIAEKAKREGEQLIKDVKEMTSPTCDGGASAPRVTRIQIGRLHNLGNYEHVRYEIALEIPDGTSAGNALANLERILADLSPRPPCGTPTRNDLETLEGRLKHARANFALGGDEVTWWAGKVNEIAEELTAGRKRHEQWSQRQEAARAALDDLGGTIKRVDAKCDWDDEV